MWASTPARTGLAFLYERVFFLYWPLYRIYKSIIDRSERLWIRGIVSRGDVVVDVGANIGVYSRYFSRLVGPEGYVVAFEPDPENFGHLALLARKHRGLAAHQMAVGDFSGTLTLYQSRGLNFDNRTFSGPDDTSAMEVPVVRLDDVSSLDGLHLSLIKVDVQGYELHVLRGAIGVLERNPHAYLLVEYAPWGLAASGASPQEFVAFLRDLGLNVFAFGGETRVIPEGFERTRDRFWYRNLVLTKREYVPGLAKVDL